jgi:hypothetical protein
VQRPEFPDPEQQGKANEQIASHTQFAHRSLPGKSEPLGQAKRQQPAIEQFVDAPLWVKQWNQPRRLQHPVASSIHL